MTEPDLNIIEVDLPEATLLVLAMEAHRLDITLNELMASIIRASLREGD